MSFGEWVTTVAAVVAAGSGLFAAYYGRATLVLARRDAEQRLFLELDARWDRVEKMQEPSDVAVTAFSAMLFPRESTPAPDYDVTITLSNVGKRHAAGVVQAVQGLGQGWGWPVPRKRGSVVARTQAGHEGLTPSALAADGR